MNLPNIQPGAVISGIIGLIFMFTIFAMIFIAIRNYGDSQAEYDDLHNAIEKEIKVLELTPANYDYIMSRLIKLGQLRFKARERTSVLTCNFFRKFAQERMKRFIN